MADSLHRKIGEEHEFPDAPASRVFEFGLRRLLPGAGSCNRKRQIELVEKPPKCGSICPRSHEELGNGQVRIVISHSTGFMRETNFCCMLSDISRRR